MGGYRNLRAWAPVLLVSDGLPREAIFVIDQLLAVVDGMPALSRKLMRQRFPPVSPT